MYWFGFGSQHHICLGCVIMFLQLLHQLSDSAGCFGLFITVDIISAALAATFRLLC